MTTMEAERMLDLRRAKQIEEFSVGEHLASMEEHAEYLLTPGAQHAYHLRMIRAHREQIERRLGGLLDTEYLPDEEDEGDAA